MRKDEAWPEDSAEYKAGNEIEKPGSRFVPAWDKLSHVHGC